MSERRRFRKMGEGVPFIIGTAAISRLGHDLTDAAKGPLMEKVQRGLTLFRESEGTRDVRFLAAAQFVQVADTNQDGEQMGIVRLGWGLLITGCMHVETSHAQGHLDDLVECLAATLELDEFWGAVSGAGGIFVPET